ncbi:uncharacterized protein [Branchiostoma lanceolatum]|uniref:uncharacterized protein isoform X3 n=1 Tax=Branchiostoma lanceolatum TaxID=7740 RepID=UPI00345124A7
MADGKASTWTQFPFKQVAVVGGILFSEDFGGSVIFPILPFLTHDFYSYLKSNQLGYHAGFLTSGHYLGNFLGSFMWGKLADKFGLSFSFAWAVFILFLGGLLAGNSRIAKTYLYEVSPAKMHAVVFAVVSLANGLAYVVGPTVGGFLSCPATRFSSLDTPVFRRFPYLLPCITSMLVAFVGLLAGFLFLEETKQQGCRGDHVTAMEEINLRVLGSDLRREGTGEKLQGGAVTSEDYGTMTNVENQEHMAPDGSDRRRDIQGKFHGVRSTLAGYQRMEEGVGSETDSWTLSRLMWDRRVMLSSLLYGLLVFVTIAVAQLLPLLLVSGYEHGGFSMDSSQISVVVTVLGAAVMVDQVFIVPWLARRLKYTTLYKYSLLIFAFGVLMIPLTASMTGPSTVVSPLPVKTAVTLPTATVLPSSQPPSSSAQTTPGTPPGVVTVSSQTSSPISPPHAPVIPASTTSKTETPIKPGKPGPNPQTPNTPGPNPQTPNTPGPNPQTPNTPGPNPQTPNTPGPNPQTPNTPGSNPQTPNPPGPNPQTPNTPGSNPQTPNAPGTNPQTPNTPGSNPQNPNTPGSNPQTPNTPVSSPQPPNTPGSNPPTPNTPGPNPQTPNTPGPNPQTPNTPGSNPQTPNPPGTNPQTPNTPGSNPQNPNTPGSNPQTPNTPGSSPQPPNTPDSNPPTPNTPGSNPQTPNKPGPNPQTPNTPGSNPPTPNTSTPKLPTPTSAGAKPQVPNLEPQAPSTPQTTNVSPQQPSSPSATNGPVSEAPFASAQVPSAASQETASTMSSTVSLVSAISLQASIPTSPAPKNSVSKSPQARNPPTGTSLVTKNPPPPQVPTSMAQIGYSPIVDTVASIVDTVASRSNNSQLVGQCRIINDTTKSMRTRIPHNVWVAVILINIIVVLGSSTALTAAMVMMGNSASPAFRGSANGIAQTMAALVRVLAPVVLGNLFAWSTDNGLPWPLNHHLSFILVVVLSLLAAFLCSRLPDAINCQREEDTLQPEDTQEGDQGFYEDGAEEYYAQQALR